jgi:hypothetical protein
MATSQSKITMEQWVEILAHQQHFGEGHGSEVLRRLGVSDSAFLEASMEWSAALGKSAGTSDDTMLSAFTKTLKETQAHLERDRPAIESIGPETPQEQWRVDETRAHVPSLSAEDILPFAEQLSPAFVASLANPPPDSPATDVGATMLPGVFVDSHGALPFGPSIVDELRAEIATRLSVEHYASLSAELAVYPQRGDRVRQRYGFHNAEEQRKEDEAWAAQFRLDPALARHWQDLVGRYQAWLLKNPR